LYRLEKAEVERVELKKVGDRAKEWGRGSLSSPAIEFSRVLLKLQVDLRRD
jgi:hypothetical protein